MSDTPAESASRLPELPNAGYASQRAKFTSDVTFFGKLSGTALKAVYYACDVFCLPSRVDRNGDSEGFPNVIIEAMACGKPVVTTRHVEIPRIVEQILVEENDVRGLADALERVYHSPSLRNELGRRNRELAKEYFSVRNVEHTAELLTGMTAPKLESPPRCMGRDGAVQEAARFESPSQLEHVV